MIDTHDLKQQWVEFERMTVRVEDKLVRMAPIATTGAFDLTQGMQSLSLKGDEYS